LYFLECQCVNGKCDNGIMGDGSCTCDSGYSGKLCDQGKSFYDVLPKLCLKLW
jgi:hypothetical protein